MIQYLNNYLNNLDKLALILKYTVTPPGKFLPFKVILFVFIESTFVTTELYSYCKE